MRLGLGISLYKRRPYNKNEVVASQYEENVVNNGGEVVSLACALGFVNKLTSIGVGLLDGYIFGVIDNGGEIVNSGCADSLIIKLTA